MRVVRKMPRAIGGHSARAHACNRRERPVLRPAGAPDLRLSGVGGGAPAERFCSWGCAQHGAFRRVRSTHLCASSVLRRRRRIFAMQQQHPQALPAPAAGGAAGAASRLLFFFLSRFRIAMYVLPLSAAVAGVRAAIWLPASSDFAALPWLEPSVVSGFIAAAIFVMALLVSGVMSDYKETERFPCDLEALFTSLLALTRHGARLRRFDAAPALAALHAMLLTTARFLDASATYGQVCAALAAHEEVLLWELDTRGAAGAATAHLAGLRGKIARAHIVRRTSFLLTAYTLTDSLVIIVVALLVLTHQTSAVTGYVNTFIFSYLFFYLGALVRDIDDPLGYGGNHNERCLLAEARLHMPARHALTDANSVDFSILFVDFACRLRAELRARGVDVDALARAPLPPSAAAKAEVAAAHKGEHHHHHHEHDEHEGRESHIFAHASEHAHVEHAEPAEGHGGEPMMGHGDDVAIGTEPPTDAFIAHSEAAVPAVNGVYIGGSL